MLDPRKCVRIFFVRCCSGKVIQCPAGGEGAGDPTGEAEEAPVPPRGKQVSAAETNGQC